MVAMYRVRTVFTGVAGTPWYSNHYFAVDGTTPAAAISAVNGLWGGLVGYIRNEVNITVEGEVLTMDSVTGQATGAANLANVTFPGTSTLSALPPATQGLLKWSTSSFQNGRQVGGKTYVPGITQGASNEGDPTTFFVSAMQAAGEAFISYADSNPVVWSKTNGTAPLINGVTGWTKFGVMRSRRD